MTTMTRLMVLLFLLWTGEYSTIVLVTLSVCILCLYVTIIIIMDPSFVFSHARTLGKKQLNMDINNAEFLSVFKCFMRKEIHFDGGFWSNVLEFTFW